MIFNLSFDSLASSGMSSQFQAELQAIANSLGNLINNNVVINIQIGLDEENGNPMPASAVGVGAAYYRIYNGNAISNAQAKVFGLISPTDPTIDGYIGIASSQLNDSQSNLIDLMYHELTHVLGRLLSNETSFSGTPTALNQFDYIAPGVLNNFSNPTVAGYFSLDNGVTDLVNFASVGRADFLSTLKDVYAGNNNPTSNLSTLDLYVLKLLGYNVFIPSASNILSYIQSNNITSHVAIRDFTIDIQNNIDSINKVINHISVIELNDSGNINITESQYTNDSAVLQLLNYTEANANQYPTGLYKLNISNVAVNQIASLLTDSHINTISISDNASNLSTNIDFLQSNINLISKINVSDGLSLSVTQTEVTNDAQVLSLITTGGGTYNVVSNTTFNSIANYNITPLYTGKNSSFSGFQITDKVGNSGSFTEGQNVQYIQFGSTNYTLESTASTSATLVNDPYVIAVDTASSATITAGSGNDVIFSGPNSTIHGGKGTTTVAFTEAFSNFTITPLYNGKNSSFSGFQIVDNTGVEGTTVIDGNVKYLDFGGYSNGATELTLGSGTYSVTTAGGNIPTSGSISTFLAYSSTLKPSSFSISDTVSNVSGSIDSLQANISKITSINITDSGDINLSETQFLNDSKAISLFNGNYNLIISNVNLINLQTVLNNNHVSSVTISDTGSNVGSNLDTLQLDNKQITGINLTDSSPLVVTYTQFTQDSNALGLITSSYNLNIIGVSTASLSSTLANSHVSSVSIDDTSNNILNNLDTIQADISKIKSVNISDGLSLSVTQAQATNDAQALSLITSDGGHYSILNSNVTLTPGQTYIASANQTIIGVSGTNTVSFTEPSTNFTTSVNGENIVVTDNSGTYGTVTLNNIQRVHFTDGNNIATDFQPGQAGFKAVMLIGTAFGSSYINQYFSAAISLFDAGQSNQQIANLIESIGLIESQLGVANNNSTTTDKAWVDLVYKNVVGVTPDVLSEASFVNDLTSGSLTKAQLLALAIGVADNLGGNIATQVNLTGIQHTGITYHSGL